MEYVALRFFLFIVSLIFFQWFLRTTIVEALKEFYKWEKEQIPTTYKGKKP